MPEKFTVNLPMSQERELRYTRAERLEFEKRFRHFGLPGMKGIIVEKVFPQAPNPQNDNKLEYTGDGDMEAQYCLVWLGIRHHNPKLITEERVAEWLDLAVTEGRPVLNFVAAAINAVMASGVLGFVPKVTVESEEVEGKAPAA
jgi:hypothetical protein